MAQITFYKQIRNDGGVRSGITIDHSNAWMHFEPGSGSDAALLWYVDVEFSGDSIDAAPQAARDLFLTHEESVKRALDEVIETLHSDDGLAVWPVTSTKTQRGRRLRVTCSAIRRLPARELAKGLCDLRETWSQHIQQLTSATEQFV